jgi:dolichol-phosphate mannosyltransferase
LKFSAVVAAYDEKENIEELARRLDTALRTVPRSRFEIIFVVEGLDGTREILERLAVELGNIRIIYRERPSGLGAAFRRGFSAVSADTDIVVTLDADLNHQPEEIPRLLDDRERLDADIIIGSRFVTGGKSEGTPLWKRTLSGVMNRVIGGLFDVEALDKTSGFRIYRAAALRQLLTYRNDDFAFLPEMLIDATRHGMRVSESPIHFKFRTHGTSKMSITQTSRSYLALLRSRFDRLSVTAIGFLALGAVARVAFAFPTHKFAPDADALLTGLRTLDILGGKLRVFSSYVRIGALECYMHAPAVLLFGLTRAAVSIAPLVSGVAILFVFFFFVRALFGRPTAVAALLFLALPSPAFTWIYLPNGYAETMLLCVTTLYVAVRIARPGSCRWWPFALGLSIGLGIWQSVQTLTCAVPALVWLLWQRPKLLLRLRFLLRVGTGAVVGALPWIIYNVVHPLATFHGNFTVRPAGRIQTVVSNARYLVRYDLRELLTGSNPFHAPPPMVPHPMLETILQAPVSAIYGLAILLLVAMAIGRSRAGTSSALASPRKGAMLLLSVTVAVALADCLSEAGQTRGYTVRYVLPLYFVAAAALGLLILGVWRRSHAAATLMTLIVLTFNFAAYNWPWTAYRHYLRDVDARDHALVAYLEKKGIRWVCGNYWVVYPINFESHRRVTGVPFQREDDHYGYGRTLENVPSAWALVVLDPNTLSRWLRNVHLEGRVEPVAGRFFVFLPSAKERARWTGRPLIAALQRARPLGH